MFERIQSRRTTTPFHKMDRSHDRHGANTDDTSPRTRGRSRSLRSTNASSPPEQILEGAGTKSDNVMETHVGGSKTTKYGQRENEAAPSEQTSEDEENHHDLSTEETGSFEEDQDDSEHTSTDEQALEAVLSNGNLVTVSLIVNDAPFDYAAANSQLQFSVGQDGNNFYCEICKDVGEIVCCDGCPKVYHQTCVPEGSPSRVALDNDEDPWFCPDCLSQNKGVSSSSQRVVGSERRTAKRVCSECRRSSGDNPLLPCEGGCGAHIHHPSCRKPENEDESIDDDAPVICSNCAAGEVVLQEEDELTQENSADAEDGIEPRHRRRRSSIGTGSMDEEMSEDDEDAETSKRKAKRKRSIGSESQQSAKKKKKDSVKKRKYTKRKQVQDSEDEVSHFSGSPDQQRAPRSYGTVLGGMVKATPAFFFFVNDNRYKLERALSRKHRYFNRLSKGLERNQLIAREAAIWWAKLRPREQRRYMNMSMRDFEERVVEFQEEKDLLEGDMDSQVVAEEVDRAELDDDDVGTSTTPADEQLTFERHKKLYVDTSVGSKPFTPEPGRSNNKLLLDLLQDMRFHSVPLLKANRSDDEPGQLDYSKMSIPYFEVHGPVATSVGDECLGCTRGWNHFCPVMKRRIPAVENRAKLQPPLSALMATRVGLGLRPRPPTTNASVERATDLAWRHADAFSKRETPEVKAARQLPPIPSFSLSQPSARADDITNFVEDAAAMKVPEPPRPSEQGSSKRSVLSRGALPMHGQKKGTATSNIGAALNKCGRCRTVIQNDTGCIQCRRAQLVINMSKQQSSKSDDNLHQVQTAMLGRLSTKDTNFEQQSGNDKAVSDAMLKIRWSPNAVLPPSKTPAPEHIPGSKVAPASSSDTDDFLEDESSMDIEMDDTLPTIKEDKAEDADIRITTSTETEGTEERSSRRKRARRVSSAAGALEESKADRQKITKQHQEETSQLNKRCVSVASCGILLAMMRRDPLLLFAEPVSDDVEAYHEIVPDPIDLNEIKSKVLNEEYKTLGAFVSDARRLCTNALAYNPVGTIYNKTARELLDALEVMQKRATEWMSAIKNSHASSFAWRCDVGHLQFDHNGTDLRDDPFRDLRKNWPEAVNMLEKGDYLRSQITADFMRTRENEAAFYGSLAVQRAAAAAEASLASYPDAGGTHNIVVRRSHEEDEALRALIDKYVVESTKAPELKDVPTWREESVIKMLRKVQTRRVEGSTSSENGCARCDGARVDPNTKMSLRAEAVRWGRNRRKGEADTIPRVASSRVSLSTGLGSSRNRVAMEKRKTEENLENLEGEIGDEGVSVRGSRIHGWGLFADQPFKPGDIVAEYVGEYVSHAGCERREKMYEEQRIQDYQFRAHELVIDATMKGGHGRYINHHCSPNCTARIVDGRWPNTHLKRVFIIAKKHIEPEEEITYNYNFPLEKDLDARVPCNCGSVSCRGFMNWDLPEKGAKNRIVEGAKRGGNMRDRIRRLNRPRKRDQYDS